MSLRYRAYSAIRWNTAATVCRALLQLAQVAVLARLLKPADFGLMAMVSVVLAFAGIFSDFGINSAYIQRQNVSEQERSSLFWLNVALSGALTLLVLLTSPLLARLFGDLRLTPLLMLAASTFAINALGQQLRMSAVKSLNFRQLVLLEVAAALLGFIAAAAAAWVGWGVYALIVGALVGAVSSSVLAWLFLANGWRPLWRFRLTDVHSYLRFGSAVVGNNLVSEVIRNIDLLLGGRMLGAAALGLYSLPRQIVFQIQGMANPIITRPGFPLIAQVQADIIRVRSIYLKTLNMTAATNAPLYVGLAFFAPDVVRIILGEKWLAATDLLRLLSMWGFLRSTGSPVGSLLLGMGRAGLSLKWNVGMLLIMPPILWLGSQFDTLGLAWALLGFQMAIFVPIWYVLVHSLCKVNLLDYSVAALRPFFLAIISIAPAYWLANQFDGEIVRLGIGVLIAAPLYLAVSFKANREWFGALQVLIKLKA